MGRHFRPLSRVGEFRDGTKRFIKWLFGAVVVVVAVAVLGNLAYDRFFGSDQAVKNQKAVEGDQAAHDKATDTAKINVVNAGDMSPGWTSPDDIAVDPYTTDYGFPGDGRAVHVGAPTTDELNGSTTVVLTLTGQHYASSRITNFRVVVDSLTSAPDGTMFLFRGQGDTPMGGVGFDISKNALDARIMKSDNEVSTDRYLDHHNVTVKKDEDEPPGFRALIIAPPDSDLKYHFQFTFDNGKSQDVYNNGQSFRLVTYPAAARRAYTLAHAGSFNGNMIITPCDWPAGCQQLANGVVP